MQKESLRTGLEMRQAVKLPNGEDRNEWIAMNTIEQFNTLTMVYDIIADFCTVKSCPLMSAASPKGEYVNLFNFLFSHRVSSDVDYHHPY